MPVWLAGCVLNWNLALADYTMYFRKEKFYNLVSVIATKEMWTRIWFVLFSSGSEKFKPVAETILIFNQSHKKVPAGSPS